MIETRTSNLKIKNHNPFSNGKMTLTLEALQNFVRTLCAGRDESHGYLHMKTVADLALQLARQENITNQKILDWVVMIGYLHDVNDHKYDHDGSLEVKMRYFLRGYFQPDEVNRILAIINLVSFSRENRYRQQFGHSPRSEWMEVLGEDGLLIRDLVSDADKLEALGEIGFRRCYQVTREMNPGVSELEIRRKMQEHFHDKLGRLASEFIITSAAQQQGMVLTEELRSRMFS